MNDFERHRNPSEPERKLDVDTLRLVLGEIASLAMVHQIEIYVGNQAARSAPEQEPLTGLELDKAIEGLTVSLLNDVREFEHRRGLREGLQSVADRVNALITQANDPR